MKIRVLLSFFLCSLLYSCTEPIDLSYIAQENTRLVVDAEIDNTTLRDTIRLSLTSNFFDEIKNIPAIGATVIIRDDSNRTFTFDESSPGIYISPLNFVGKANHNYYLEITYEGQVYSAVSFLNPPIAIDTLTCKRLEDGVFTTREEVEIGISFQDPPGKRNYYWFIDYVNGANEYESLFEYGALFNDEFVNGLYLNNITYGTFDLDSGDVLKIELRTINKREEEILSALAIESFESGIFDAPPSNVPTNISNGALGIFVAYGRTVREIEINK
ncbi:DUF4249 domain-containing protein [Luteibaculum oceani]|uniref:DUF4249 domain-containing protein n=1 Tax=Luteibaculum oceani TaxID=1294296 RepID=A0A5C6VK16_9FLAO|nr:DUF4249 domain-containing protein [Luteibaculum oceani]TXC85400.1 DUF4249 domain-containing protein [Luteibaculum oceani]